jgi:diacylglycerol kinase family enzyme
MRRRGRIVTIARFSSSAELRLRSAILTNPHSSRNRRQWPRLRTALSHRHDIKLIETQSLDDLDGEINALLADGVELLAINGGDGTVHLVLSALLRACGDAALPSIALLPGGTTNMSARDVNGAALSLRTALDSWLDAVDQQRPPQPRHVLRINGTGAPAQLGFCLGMGAIVRGIEYCHERIYRLGLKDEWASGVAVLRAAWGIARREAIFAQGVPLQISIDEDRHDTRAAFLIVAALDQLMLGIHPFWGSGDAPLHVTLVSEHAQRFLRSFPDLLRGRADPHLTEAAGYLSRRGHVIEVQGNSPYTIDGEIYHSATKTIRIDAFGPLKILRLGDNA